MILNTEYANGVAFFSIRYGAKAPPFDKAGEPDAHLAASTTAWNRNFKRRATKPARV